MSLAARGNSRQNWCRVPKRCTNTPLKSWPKPDLTYSDRTERLLGTNVRDVGQYNTACGWDQALVLRMHTERWRTTRDMLK